MYSMWTKVVSFFQNIPIHFILKQIFSKNSPITIFYVNLNEMFTIEVLSLIPTSVEMYLKQLHVIKFCQLLGQVYGFL
jgi:hypothetical protein